MPKTAAGETALMTIRVIRYLLTLPCVMGAAWMLGGPQAAFAQNIDSQPLGDGMELFQVRPNFYVLTGAGSNIGVQLGVDGAVVVDAGDAAHADRLVAELKKLTSHNPIRYVIDTSADADHVGGNEKVAKAGRNLTLTGNAARSTVNTAAAIVGAGPVLLRMSVAGYPESATPTDAFVGTPRYYMYLNGEGIEVLHQENAHTDGDSFVFFRRSDVVMAGDIIDIRRFPVIDLANGGSVNGEIEALNRLIELAIPSIPIISREAGTVVVPSHGRLLDQTDVVEYRDMVVVVRDRIQQLMKKGRTLAQIKTANPTRGYTKRYGSDTGSWTTDMFVEAVYKSLAADGSKQR